MSNSILDFHLKNTTTTTRTTTTTPRERRERERKRAHKTERNELLPRRGREATAATRRRKEGKTTTIRATTTHREQVQHLSSSTAQVVHVVDPRPRYTPPAIGVPENDPGPIFLGPGNHAPMRMNCYRCQKEVLTEVERKSGTGNLFAAIVTFGISLLMCQFQIPITFLSRVQRVDWRQ